MENNINNWIKDFQDQWSVSIFAFQEKGGLRVRLKGKRAEIIYEETVQFFRGLGFIRQWLEAGITDKEITERAVFGHLTYMVDCSRNAVCSVSWLKDFIQKLAFMGYDRLMLYTEETYEIEGEPFWGYLRGRYSKNELQELDAYAQSYGIEMVPCIQTLAHLLRVFQWDVYSSVNDTGDILLCGADETYALIEKMIVSMAESLQSKTIHIGMDEAEMIGCGKYLSKFGYEERAVIMERHVKRVVEICKKHGYETCIMWADMYFKIMSGGGYFDALKNDPKDFAGRIPEGVELMYWDYYIKDKVTHDRMLEAHKKMTDNVSFAGGVWKWTGFAPFLSHSLEVSKLALESCHQHNISHVMVTGWGDGGAEASQASVLPGLAVYAEYQYAQRTDTAWISERLYACTEADFDEFMLLECVNMTPDNPYPGEMSKAFARYILYQDILMGIFDKHVKEEVYSKYYSECALKLGNAAAKEGAYSYMFRTLAALAEVLAQKADMGIKLKRAYEADDKVCMKQLANECTPLIEKIDIFHNCLRIQWMTENKVFGLEALDIRLGALKERVRRTEERVCDYLEGRVERIEELEQERLPICDEDTPGWMMWSWKKAATAAAV